MWPSEDSDLAGTPMQSDQSLCCSSVDSCLAKELLVFLMKFRLQGPIKSGFAGNPTLIQNFIFMINFG